MPEFNKNLWAPWRMEYIGQLHEETTGCFLCHARDNPDRDEQTYTLFRGENCFVILNRFPYTSGHMLIAPYTHTSVLGDLDDATLFEMMRLTRDMQALLQRVVRAEGYNIGINLGRCAGAGLPDHLHCHLVPRWGGDTNFMAVLDGVRIMPDAIDQLYRRLKENLKDGQ